MMHEWKYCRICGIGYGYQISGYDCGDILNNSQYCKDCMIVLAPVISTIKKRVRQVLLDTDDYTFDECKLEFEKQRDAEDTNKLKVTKFICPMFDIEDRENKNIIREVKMPNRKIYRFSYWTKKDDTYVKRLALWDDLLNEETF